MQNLKISFQVTVSHSHSIVACHVIALCKNLGWALGDVRFVFVVPEGPESVQFPLQSIDRSGLQITTAFDIKQYMVYITKQQFSYESFY